MTKSINMKLILFIFFLTDGKIHSFQIMICLLDINIEVLRSLFLEINYLLTTDIFA